MNIRSTVDIAIAMLMGMGMTVLGASVRGQESPTGPRRAPHQRSQRSKCEVFSSTT